LLHTKWLHHKKTKTLWNPGYHRQGFHSSGNGQGKKFYKVREKSGNFILSQGKLAFQRKLREN